MFEVHLITAPGALVSTKFAPEGAKRVRVGEARTLYGDHPIQPMLTYWHEDGIKTAHETAEKMGNVIRIKVEAMPSSGNGVLKEGEYWEFHAKLDGPWDECAKICLRHGVPLFWNAAKPGQVPIINLRRYHGTFDEALTALKALTTDLTAADIKFSEVHREHGILDTAPELDEGWLYKEGQFIYGP